MKNQPADSLSTLTLSSKEIFVAVTAFGFNVIRLFQTNFEGPPKEINTDLGGRSIVVITCLVDLFGSFGRFLDSKPSNY